VLTFGVALPESQYQSMASVHTFFQRLRDRLAQIPGVMAAGYGTGLPLENYGGRLISAENANGNGRPIVDNTDIDGDYFQSLGQKLVAGRYFDRADRKDGELVEIVNQAFGRAFWPGQNAVGHRFKIGPPSSTMPWIRIVGVVADSSSRAPDQPVGPHMYTPFDQEQYPMGMHQAWFVLRTGGDAAQSAGAVNRVVHALDPSLPVLRLRSMEQVVAAAMAPRSANTWLVTVFAIAAVLLTALGIYGVVAQSVAERTREIGIRMALGALRSDVAASVFGQGGRLMLIGLTAGIAGSLAVSRLISSLLYGVTGMDIVTLAAVAGIMALTTFAAALLPSWRAVHVEPWSALREN